MAAGVPVAPAMAAEIPVEVAATTHPISIDAPDAPFTHPFSRSAIPYRDPALTALRCLR